jgi:hypothetical protein
VAAETAETILPTDSTMTMAPVTPVTDAIPMMSATYAGAVAPRKFLARTQSQFVSRRCSGALRSLTPRRREKARRASISPLRLSLVQLDDDGIDTTILTPAMADAVQFRDTPKLIPLDYPGEFGFGLRRFEGPAGRASACPCPHRGGDRNARWLPERSEA